MMRSPSTWAVAVRTPTVASRRSSRTSPRRWQRRRIWRLPVIRGVIALGESLAIGFRALAISANYAAQEEGEDGEVRTEITRGQIIFSFAIAIGFALMLFKVGPALLTSWLPIDDTGSFVIVEGVIRVAVFIAYIALISLIPDLRARLPVPRRRAQGDQRPRGGRGAHARTRAEVQLDPPALRNCLFALGHGDRHLRLRASSGRPVWYWLIASRILLLPVIAGLAYELIRFAGKHQDNRLLMTLLAPGLWLQRLTTREPSLDQIEVSIRALEEVLDREERDHRARAQSRSDGLMPRIVREAEATWEGTMARGPGR